MAYIPEDSKWYIAKIVEEITIEGELKNVVHTNVMLIRADSPDEAYDKAIALGKEGQDIYKNPAGKTVRAEFRGLSGLNVVHGELEHGTELFYEERIGFPSEKLEQEILPKSELPVFRQLGSRKEPDYSVKEIVDEATVLRGGWPRQAL